MREKELCHNEDELSVRWWTGGLRGIRVKNTYSVSLRFCLLLQDSGRGNYINYEEKSEDAR